MCEDSRLLEEAKYNPTAELAIVLGERLETVWVEYEAQVGEVTDHAKELEEDVDRYLLEIGELEHKIDVLEVMLAKANDAKDAAERHADEIHARMQELERSGIEQSEAIRNGDRLFDELSQRIRNLKEQQND
jgi:uncharacterized coiled-coil DUF342 family protein